MILLVWKYFDDQENNYWTLWPCGIWPKILPQFASRGGAIFGGTIKYGGHDQEIQAFAVYYTRVPRLPNTIDLR